MAPNAIDGIITWDPDNLRCIASYYAATPLSASEYQAVFVARNGEPHLIGGGALLRDSYSKLSLNKGSRPLTAGPSWTMPA